MYEPRIEAAAEAICQSLAVDVWPLLPQSDRDKYRSAAEDALAAVGWEDGDSEVDW